MNRRSLLTQLSASLVLVSLEGCSSSEAEIVRYAVIAGTAAASIGQIVSLKNPELGERIINSANALVAAAERWEMDTGLEGHLVQALNALKDILETIPSDAAGQAVVLIPIAIAAIQSIFILLVKQTGKGIAQSKTEGPYKPAALPHRFGHMPHKDFEDAWNAQVQQNHIPDVITFP